MNTALFRQAAHKTTVPVAAATMAILCLMGATASPDPVWAQAVGSGVRSTGNQPAKPPTLAPSAPSTRGGLGAGERLMTREELRQCLARSDALVAERDDLERVGNALTQQRKELEAAAEKLKTEKVALMAESEQRQNAFKQRSDQLSARVMAFREQMTAASSGIGPRPTRAQTAKMEAEREALDAEIKALNSERDALVNDLEQKLKDYNDRVSDRDALAQAWTSAAKVKMERNQRFDGDGDTWRRECGNRPYREEDERAIRAGK